MTGDAVPQIIERFYAVAAAVPRKIIDPSDGMVARQNVIVAVAGNAELWFRMAYRTVPLLVLCFQGMGELVVQRMGESVDIFALMTILAELSLVAGGAAHIG